MARSAALTAAFAAALCLTPAAPAAAAPSGGTAALAGGGVVLMRGDRGPAVKLVQRRLGAPATGLFGPITERAVKRFQRRRRLTVHGVVGPATRRALRLRPFGRDGVRPQAGAPVRLPGILWRIARCESGGNPRAVSRDGRYRGKYQFSLATWRGLGGSGDPARAPEWLQDRLALKLYRLRGTSAWPACGR